MLSQESIRLLATTRPGRFAPISELQQTIESLESDLGVPKQPKTFNIVRAKARIEELQALSAMVGAAKASTGTSTAASPAQPLPAKSGASLTTAQLLKLSSEVNPGHGYWKYESEAKQRAAAAQWFHCRHLTYPGCEADFAALDTEAARRQPLASFDGLAISGRAFTQAAINSAVLRITGAKR